MLKVYVKTYLSGFNLSPTTGSKTEIKQINDQLTIDHNGQFIKSF